MTFVIPLGSIALKKMMCAYFRKVFTLYIDLTSQFILQNVLMTKQCFHARRTNFNNYNLPLVIINTNVLVKQTLLMQPRQMLEHISNQLKCQSIHSTIFLCNFKYIIVKPLLTCVFQGVLQNSNGLSDANNLGSFSRLLEDVQMSLRIWKGTGAFH